LQLLLFAFYAMLGSGISNNPSFNAGRRPAMISELAEAARKTDWDPNGSVKYFLRHAERNRREGQTYFEQKDLESSFVSFARAASLILEKIPNHREYKTLLSAAQRENLAQVRIPPTPQISYSDN
jgi:STAM-binding protein